MNSIVVGGVYGPPAAIIRWLRSEGLSEDTIAYCVAAAIGSGLRPGPASVPVECVLDNEDGMCFTSGKGGQSEHRFR